ncbi:MAG: threonine--tRNA ligase [Candidatus Eisenbacteria bacterium]
MQDQDIAKAVAGLDAEAAALYRIRHSLAHVLAQAVLSFQPTAKLGFGPPVEHGFYYDFDLPEPITAADLPKLQKKMKEILRQKQPFARSELSAVDALAKVGEMAQPYKHEAASDLRDKGVQIISFYENGPFVDMCEGPHVETTKEIPEDAFLLDSIAGAYWRGSEKNKMLTRIYGLAFRTKQELDDYLARRKLAQERDHKKLGRELELFHIEDEIGKGLILWLPKGTVLRDEVEALAKDFEFRYGYDRVSTPHITKQELYYRSGHLPYYKESMFPPMEVEETAHEVANGEDLGAHAEGEGQRPKEVFYLKPMNCPHHHMIYKHRPRSYRELPVRLAEYGTCYRFEQSGELSGLLRVRCLTMNDAHIYVTRGQALEEIARILEMYREIYQVFEFTNYRFRLSLHDPARREKYHDNEALWQEAEAVVREALVQAGVDYYVGEDEAAFYGPKIDIQFKNLLGREETVSTIQYDSVSPERFDLHYIDEHGQEQRPVILHRAPLSTHERMLSYLIEHYGGAFPTWMAPVQVRLITVSDDLLPYAEEVQRKLRADRERAEIDLSPHSFGKKIRHGAIEKLPILLVIGKKEAEEGTVTLRRYQVERQETLAVDAFQALLRQEIAERRHVRA